jgi:hypothetical protein
VDDVWRIAVDIYSFAWLPLWIVAAMLVIVVAALFVGRFIHVGSGDDR